MSNSPGVTPYHPDLPQLAAAIRVPNLGSLHTAGSRLPRHCRLSLLWTADGTSVFPDVYTAMDSFSALTLDYLDI